MIFPAITIANAFISFSDPEKGDIISNLKIQKLLYYAQGLHPALYKKSLFKEDIVKWAYGPVVPEVYEVLKQYGSNAIPVPEQFEYSIFSDQHIEVLTEVYLEFGQYSSVRLMNMTNEEPPYQKVKLNGVIAHQNLMNYFITQLNI